MKKLILFFILITKISNSQTTTDLFKTSDVKISWLGVDFSHVKLIGNFAQFFNAGEKSSAQIRDKYFREWNEIIMAEPKKYDVAGMFRKGDVFYDVQDIFKINAKAPLEEMESYNTPKYSIQEITAFVNQYDTSNKDGIGLLFIAETLNKNADEAYFHFVAINMKTKEILIHERLLSKPRGFGLRNFWAGSIYDTIKEITNNKYSSWKHEYK